jgi:hypothetical protein
MVQPNDPIGANPLVDLWYDDDAVAASMLASLVAFTPPGAPLSAANMQAAMLQLPRGLVARRVGTASSFTTTVTASPGADITVTAGQAPSIAIALDTARAYRFHFFCPAILSTNTDRVIWELLANGVLVRSLTVMGFGSAFNTHYVAEWIVVPTSAAVVTYKMAARVTGTATISIPFASAATPIEFTIEDIGVAV